MDFVDLTNEYLIHVDEIDAQHNEMAHLLNLMYEIMGQGLHEEEMILVDNLQEHVIIHFRTEEDLMKESKYPGYISHKMEHDRFAGKNQKFVDDVKNGSQVINLEYLKAARKWFFNHIEINDIKLGIYLLENIEMNS